MYSSPCQTHIATCSAVQQTEREVSGLSFGQLVDITNHALRVADNQRFKSARALLSHTYLLLPH
jgi:hypothetical protein